MPLQAHKVELKTFTGESAQENLNYLEILSTILSVPADRRNGMQMAEIRRCNKILDLLDTANGVAYLTPDDHSWLVKRIDTFPFNIGGRLVQQFGDDMRDAELIDLDEKRNPVEVIP